MPGGTGAQPDSRKRRARLLFVDYSLAFRSSHPVKLITELHDLGISNSLNDCVLDCVQINSNLISVPRRFSVQTGIPQGEKDRWEKVRVQECNLHLLARLHHSGPQTDVSVVVQRGR